MSHLRSLLCPSAQPGMSGLRLLGVVEHTAEGPRVAYLNEDVAVTSDLLAQTAPAQPTEVFRIAGRCEERTCTHYNGQSCTLATRIVQILPAVVDSLPPCLIRTTCRWFEQEGKEACLRCPQVVTESFDVSQDYKKAALGHD